MKKVHYLYKEACSSPHKARRLWLVWNRYADAIRIPGKTLDYFIELISQDYHFTILLFILQFLLILFSPSSASFFKN
jgi:hypothetical protein